MRQNPAATTIRAFLALVLIVVLATGFFTPATTMAEDSKTASAQFKWIESQPAGLSIGLRSELQPLTINQMHSWIIQLQTPDAEPVSDASIRVDGGMPAHNHGLATQPQITTYLGDGNYLLEGMRFHMNGEWELRLLIQHAGREHRAVVKLQL